MANVITLNSHDYPAKAYTVFFDRAEAKREFPGIKLTKGLNEVVIENLPPTLQDDYLGVDGKGPAMIIDVRCSVQYTTTDDANTRSANAVKLESLQKQRKRIATQIGIFNSKESVLKDVLVAAASSDKFNFSDGLDMYDQKKLEISEKMEELEEQLAEIDRRIQEVGVYVPTQVRRKTVRVNLEAEEECEVSLTITTIMYSVTFVPSYTLRASSTGSDNSLKIRYLAKITNNSGEDWKDVSLSISTAQASETTVIPDLQRWTVNFQHYVPQTKSMSMAKKRSMVPMASRAAPAGPSAQMMWQQAEVTRGGGFEKESFGESFGEDMATGAAEVSEGITSTFLIPGRQTIQDGETGHTVVIRDLVLEGKFANICVPKIKDIAYLQARVKNNTDYPLLPGDVNIFLDGAFVGKTEFNYVTPGEFLNVCLGVDKGITVKYHPRQKINSKRGTLISRTTIQCYSQVITIRNLKNVPLQKLTLIDQIPISEDKAITVSLITPPKEKLINIAEEDNAAGFTLAAAATSKGSLRASISSASDVKGGKEKDRILWNPDTGKVTWDFIDVKAQKTLEIKLEWEIIAGDRNVHSHFGDKI